MPNNIEIKFKKKAYNESTDAGNGIIVFDTTDNKIYVGGVCYSSSVADASYSNGTLTITKRDGTSQDVIIPDMLNSLRDVTITNPTSGQSIVYDEDNNTFINDFGLAGSIPYGRCDSTSTSTAFTATVPGITELKDGTCMLLKNGVVSSAEGFTINVNDLGAKRVVNNMATATYDTTIFNSKYTMLFIYDETRVSGGCWICYRGYDTNTDTIGYQLRTNSSVRQTVTKTRYYRILFSSADNTKWVPANTSYDNSATSIKTPNQNPINPFGRIVYMSGTTNVPAASNVGATVTWDQYAVSLGYSFNNTGTTLSLSYPAPVYIKCSPQTDGSAIIDSSTPYVQSLPSTADGYIYIYLGHAYSATAVELVQCHPVFYHDGTGIRAWTGNNVNIENVTYSQLTTKIAENSGAGSLEPGKLYRITDYVTTTKNGTNPDITSSSVTYKSSGHQFDLIVMAISSSKLDCHAKAIIHSGDTYFSNADLRKWQIWYDFDNDTLKYDWADSTNGKGVIYRMIDERNNDCSYDFKNILFKRKLTNGSYDTTSGTLTWVYTFGGASDASASLSTNTCYNNTLKEYISGSKYLLPDNVFLGSSCNINTLDVNCYNNTFGDGCSGNTFMANCYNNTLGSTCPGNSFGVSCYGNTLGDYCYSNIFKNGCYDNTFGTACYNNTFGSNCTGNVFGDGCYNITFGNECQNNNIGDSCYNNTFEDNCDDNTFGNYSSNNTFGNSSSNNTFGDSCIGNVFGDGCSYNTFEDNCDNNTFGNSSSNNTFGDSNNQNGDYIRYITIEGGNQFIRLYNSSAASDSSYLQNIYIAKGVNNSDTYLDISTIARNLGYRTTVGRDSSRNLIIYNEDDPAASSVDTLTDTVITSPSNAQVLMWNSASSKWVNGTVGSASCDFTHTANAAVSGSVTVTYGANVRSSRMVSASGDLSVTFAVNNSSDNYLWIKNTGSSDIDILIAGVSYNNTAVSASNIYLPSDGISVPKGFLCEIGIAVNSDGAFITSRSDLALTV